MQYPFIAAGQRITAGLMQSMLPVYIIKPASTTRANTATPTDDPDLTTTLAANATYFVEMFLHYGCENLTVAVGFKTDWTVPSGAGGLRTCMGPGSTATDANANNITMRSGAHGYATTAVYGGRGDVPGNQLLAIETATMTTTNAGTLALQWSQGAANATGSLLAANSMMRITRLA